MKLNIISIMLDGMPFVHRQLETFNRLRLDWHWSVVSGVAEPVGCTSWCQRMPPRLSRDGSHEIMLELAQHHPRVSYIGAPSWPGKVAMLNWGMASLTEPGILLEVDMDECWSAHQLEALVMAFEQNPKRDCAIFGCRFFVGPDIVMDHSDNWLRAWRYDGQQRFLRHEPPDLQGSQQRPFSQEQTKALGLTYDHYAYAYESQVAWKEQYYGYKDAVTQWRRLQANTQWPARVGDYMGWIKDDVMCDRVNKS